ncbi:hypothetical protein [uncultured Levyella sp.]|uniref:hypothetical protein n=1 Tax=Levyella massiliensis TaxID=938289 RepID=UPI0025851BAE|nr:hypothetical protein [uncultured Levyella sp.]
MNNMEQVVAYIKENIEEITKEKGDVAYGTLIGYVETLTIIKSVVPEADWKKLGLDFDLDKRYLI